MLSVFNNSIQLGLWIVWSKLSYRRIYMYHYIFFFHADRHINPINKETDKKYVDAKCDIYQSMRKKTKNGNSQVFKKPLLLAFDKFGFFNFVDINFEKFAGTNFPMPVTETLYFWHIILSCKLWTFCRFFSEIYVSFINCDIVFCI